MLDSPDGDHSWRALLGGDAYKVLFERATEAPFSSALHREIRPGTYVCAACLTPLFDAAEKRVSGTGWPTFRGPLPGALRVTKESTRVPPRIEYACATCGGHQGHVLRDIPWIWRLRWCNNGLALRFVPEGVALPSPRSRP